MRRGLVPGLVILQAFLLTAVLPSVIEASSITITATPFATSETAITVLDVVINDDGSLPECTLFRIVRRAIYPCGVGQSVVCIEREVGTSRSLQFSDQAVQPNTSYVYQVVGEGSAFPPLPALCELSTRCDDIEFAQAFDPSGWGFPIISIVSMGPEPTPVAHARLLPPLDAVATFSLEPCQDSCPTFFGQGAGGPEINQYVGTGTAVLLYGTVSYCCNCCGFILSANAAMPQSCTVAAENLPWSQVKVLYGGSSETGSLQDPLPTPQP